MRWDFWNNPLVVTALQIKYRRGGLVMSLISYMMLLVIFGAALEYFWPSIFTGPRSRAYTFQQIYFILVMSFQHLASPLLAVSATSSSMRSEVMNRTLDFQRIAAVTPQEILLGKLIGEPSLAYLLIVATLPFTMLCTALQVPDLSLWVLLLMYVSLLTTTLMLGCTGLLHTLQIADPKNQYSGQAGGWMWLGLVSSLWGGIGLTAAAKVTATQTFWAAIPAGFFLPVFPLARLLAAHNPWEVVLPFFGLRIPYLYITPITQLVLAGMCFTAMTRRLLNPLETLMSKKTAFILLFVLDILLVGTLYEPSFVGIMIGRQPEQREQTVKVVAGLFLVVHLLASMALLGHVTPAKETLSSWVWRYRGRRARWLDLLLGQRSDTRLVQLCYLCMGVAFLGVLVLLGAMVGPMEWDVSALQNALPTLLAMLTVSSLFYLAAAQLMQLNAYLGGPGWGAGSVIMLAMLAVVPHIAGRYFGSLLIMSLAPSAYYFEWVFADSAVNLQAASLSKSWYLGLYVAVYGGLYGFLTYSFRRILHNQQAKVDVQLVKMGVR